ncbi:MAG: PD-(D/E)XK nuclease family protein [Candidatus Woesearchaeota archaeon]
MEAELKEEELQINNVNSDNIINKQETQLDLSGNDIVESKNEVVESKNEIADRKPEEIATTKFPRIQSPSSINTFKQCPRKYYYHYIEKLESLPSIHLVRGKLTHSVLEDFFLVNVEHLNQDSFMFDLRIIIMELFKKHWQANLEEMEKLGLTKQELDFYKQETKYMVEIWVKRFIHNVAEDMNSSVSTSITPLTFKEAISRHTPKTEEEYRSNIHGVRGFIDAIHEYENEINGQIKKEVHVIDYKTSKRAKMSPEYKLQLAIYAMLYEEKHGILPNKVGLDFLKFDEGPMCIDADRDLVEFAIKEISLIHENTKSKNKKDYRKQISALCKWHSGQCDFYDLCKDED